MVAKREPKDPEFQALWEERLSRGLPPLMRSSLHRHEPDCWSDPFDAYLPGTFDAYLPGT